MKIKFMLAQKFLVMVESVMDNIEYRHLDAAFDGIVAQANENLDDDEQDISDLLE